MSVFCFKVHTLERLSEEHSLELFNKKAFHGRCPENLTDISYKIVEKCKGLPLAIVLTGRHLSKKDKNRLKWHKFSEIINARVKGIFHDKKKFRT